MEAILPCGCIGGVFAFIVGLGVLGAWSENNRKKQYLPPKISIEGHGIKRGLTAVEAALLMELPLDKVLTMMLFGLVKKNAASVVTREPLELKVSEPLAESLYDYEKEFLKAFQSDNKALRPRALQEVIVNLIKSLQEKMKGFSRKESIDYYRSIAEKAWTSGCRGRHARGEGSGDRRQPRMDDARQGFRHPLARYLQPRPGVRSLVVGALRSRPRRRRPDGVRSILRPHPRRLDLPSAPAGSRFRRIGRRRRAILLQERHRRSDRVHQQGDFENKSRSGIHVLQRKLAQRRRRRPQLRLCLRLRRMRLRLRRRRTVILNPPIRRHRRKPAAPFPPEGPKVNREQRFGHAKIRIRRPAICYPKAGLGRCCASPSSGRNPPAPAFRRRASTITSASSPAAVAARTCVVAEDGGAPVLLDDALGHSDPQRLAGLGRALALAGRRCQILVLTCDPARYRHVEGARLIELAR